MAEVTLGGAWLHELGAVGDIKWSSRWGEDGCGPDLASCTVVLDPANDTSRLRLGSTFEVWADGVKVFGGVLSEMGRDFPRTLSARGWVRRGDDFDAVDSDGNPTTDPSVATSEAISNGLPWTGNPFSSGSFGTDGNPTTTRLSDLLSRWSAANGKRWGVTTEGAAFLTQDPTSASWFLDASDLDIGVADDGLFTRVRARYVSSLDGTTGEPNGWSTVSVDDGAGQALYGVIEYPMDLTGLGMLTPSTALDYATAQRDLLTIPQWLSRVTTNPTRLLSPGGLPAHLPSVQAGQMVRLFNVPNNLGGLRGELGLDVVLGEVEYDTNSPSEITIAPVGLAVRNLADLAAQSARAAEAA